MVVRPVFIIFEMATTGLTASGLELCLKLQGRVKVRFWGGAICHEGLEEKILYTISLKASTHTCIHRLKCVITNNSYDAFASYCCRYQQPTQWVAYSFAVVEQDWSCRQCLHWSWNMRKGFVSCAERGQTCTTLISCPANATSRHHDMFTGAGLSLFCAEK